MPKSSASDGWSLDRRPFIDKGYEYSLTSGLDEMFRRQSIQWPGLILSTRHCAPMHTVGYERHDISLFMQLGMHWRAQGRNVSVVDVGANCGIYASIMSRIGHRVIAIDPLPACISDIKWNRQRNCWDWRAASRAVQSPRLRRWRRTPRRLEHEIRIGLLRRTYWVALRNTMRWQVSMLYLGPPRPPPRWRGRASGPCWPRPLRAVRCAPCALSSGSQIRLPVPRCGPARVWAAQSSS